MKVLKRIKISDAITDKISGEWGDEVDDGFGIKVLRTTNFTNDGILNLENIVERKIKPELVAKKKLIAGDVIIEKSGGSPNQPVGRVVYFNEKGTDYLCNNFTAILRPGKVVYPKYFFYALFYLHLSKGTLRYQNKTTGILNLKLERYLEEETIPLPDLKTQQEIAHVLEQADKARQQRKAANVLTDEFLQSSFLSLFGDPVKNEKGWEVKELKKLIRDGDKINYGIVQPGDEIQDGVQIVRIGDFNGLSIDKSNLKRVLPSIDEKHKNSRLIGDEVLVACVGHTIGKVALADESLKDFNIVRAVARIRCNSLKLDRFFLAYYLMTRSVQDFFIRELRTSGQPTLNIKQLEETKIILPPLSLQQQFAAIVAEAEALRKKQQESEQELEQLFQSLLQGYFG
jgi:type I restriction enzyme, S subunit